MAKAGTTVPTVRGLRALKALRADKDIATDELTERSNPSGWSGSYSVLCWVWSAAHRGNVGTLETQQTCASVRALDRSL